MVCLHGDGRWHSWSEHLSTLWLIRINPAHTCECTYTFYILTFTWAVHRHTGSYAYRHTLTLTVQWNAQHISVFAFTYKTQKKTKHINPGLQVQPYTGTHKHMHTLSLSPSLSHVNSEWPARCVSGIFRCSPVKRLNCANGPYLWICVHGNCCLGRQQLWITMWSRGHRNPFIRVFAEWPMTSPETGPVLDHMTPSLCT